MNQPSEGKNSTVSDQDPGRVRRSLLAAAGMAAVLVALMLLPIPAGKIGSFWKFAQAPTFPWPPPQASGMTVLPRGLLVTSADGRATLGDVQSRLERALDRAGYADKSFFSASDGFVLVTRLEQFSDTGTPIAGDKRWSHEAAGIQQFSLREYMTALFSARRGRFRVIVFVVTPISFSQSGAKVDRETTIDWLARGANKLPPDVAATQYTEMHDCTALIYEFFKAGPDEKAVLTVPGLLPAREHLTRANILRALEKI